MSQMEVVIENPNPTDFVTYLPWACKKLHMSETILVSKHIQNEYVSVDTLRNKAKILKTTKDKSAENLTSDTDIKKQSVSSSTVKEAKTVGLTAIYSNDNLIQIKFQNKKIVPKIVLKVIGLLLQFNPFLYSITINSGLDAFTVHELNKLLVISNITDICLDNTYLNEANYHILLESKTQLKHLSLARCKINDIVIQRIAAYLVHPLPSSKSLVILNLSSNMVTDEGAKHLAEVLRSNRKLYYLNLANNMITDEGANAILSYLMEFCLTKDEIMAARVRYVSYLKEIDEFVACMVKETRISGSEGQPKKAKALSGPGKKRKGTEKESKSPDSSIGDLASKLNQRAKLTPQNLIEFNDPFNKSSTYSKNAVIYCKGNNTLCYLNLAYNNLSYLVLKKLLAVLMYQKVQNRKPKGLVNLSLEGNPMPVVCEELVEINEHLEMGLMVQNRRISIGMKKRPLFKKIGN